MEKIIVCCYDKKFLPERKSLWAVCWDLRIVKDIKIGVWELLVIWTGVKAFIPHGRHSKVYARSGLPVKMWLMLANSVAIFDADYRGEYMMQLYNFWTEELVLEKYTRVSQMEFLPYYYDSGKFGTAEIPELEFIVDEKLYGNFEKEFPSVRGEGRFNSTGKE